MFFYCIVIVGVILDLISKYFASIFLNEKIEILWNFLYVKHIKNDGIAFSINIPFLKTITIVLILGIFYYYFKEEIHKKSKLIDIAFGLILAGAIGNGIERILYGEVTDFIGISGFAVFNIADSFITIGAIIYLYYSYISGALDHKK